MDKWTEVFVFARGQVTTVESGSTRLAHPSRSEDVVSSVTMTQHAGLDKMVIRCSSYRRLLRIVAWLSRLLPLRVRRNNSLSADELDVAKERLLHFVQRGACASDLERLQAGCALDKGNQLSRLTPCLRWSASGWRMPASQRPDAPLTTSSDSVRPSSHEDNADPACA